MKKVFQTLTDKGKGDCWRAVIASLFNLEIEQVPHFLLFDKSQNDLIEYNENKYGRISSFGIFWYFLNSLGWTYNGLGRLPNELQKEDSVDGYFYASVPSKNYKGIFHAVVIDINGLVVHDPHPKQQYLGINVKDSKELNYWYLLSRKDKETEIPHVISKMCDGISNILRECDHEEANEGEIMYYVPEEWLLNILEKQNGE